MRSSNPQIPQPSAPWALGPLRRRPKAALPLCGVTYSGESARASAGTFDREEKQTEEAAQGRSAALHGFGLYAPSFLSEEANQERFDIEGVDVSVSVGITRA